MKKYSKLMAILLAVAMLLPGIAQAAPVEVNGVEVTRLGGVDRVGTSVLASQEAYKTAKSVVIAGFGGDVDALTGTLLAADAKAPLLVTRQFELSEEVENEIKRLGAETAYILGGANAVSEEVVTELQALDVRVVRVDGENRDDTAAKVAKRVKGEKAEHVFLALGRMPVETDALADALAIGPVSATMKSPVLLTKKDSLPAETKQALKDLNVERITIVGETSAVSAELATELAKDYTVDRVGGASREKTAIAIAEKYFASPSNLIVAYGRKSADALVGGYLGALKNAPILLTNHAGLTAETKAYIEDHILDTFVLGGTTVVPESAFDQIVEALKGEEVEEKELKVESVSAINASELKVTFSGKVDEATAETKANYDLKINDVKVTDTQIADIKLAEDGKSALILLDKSAVAFSNGDRYIIQTNDAIKDTEGNKLEKFVSEEMTFSQSAAPSLVSVKKDGDALKLKFDRPVDANMSDDVTLVKIDGIEIGSTDLKAVDSEGNETDILQEAGLYEYKIAITDTDAIAQAKKNGTHEVVIFDVQDTAAEYAKVASVLTGSYTISSTVIAPEVTGIEEINANKFFVYTNTDISLEDDSIVKVMKSSHEFPKSSQNFNDEITTGPVTVAGATVGTHKNKPGIWVVVTDNRPDGELNPLYRASETKVNLTVTVEKYRSVETPSLIGKKSVQNITLNKNNTKPEVKTTVLKNSKELVVTFMNDIADPTFVEGTDFVVRNKDNVIIEKFNATVSGADVTFVHANDLEDAPYTIEFKANKFQNEENLDSVEGYIANTLKNDKMTVTVDSEAESNFIYKEFDLETVATTNGNIIDLDFSENMDASAADVSNYLLDGKALPTGTTVDFVGDKQNVRVVFPEETFKLNTKYKFSATTNVKTEAGARVVGSLQTKAPAEFIFTSVDNVKPVLKSALYYVTDDVVTKDTVTKEIEVTFDEAVTGIDSEDNFKVIVNGSEFEVASVAQAAGGTNPERKLVLTLEENVNVNQSATITVVLANENDEDSVNIIDTAIPANKAKVGVSVTASTTLKK